MRPRIGLDLAGGPELGQRPDGPGPHEASIRASSGSDLAAGGEVGGGPVRVERHLEDAHARLGQLAHEPEQWIPRRHPAEDRDEPVLPDRIGDRRGAQRDDGLFLGSSPEQPNRAAPQIEGVVALRTSPVADANRGRQSSRSSAGWRRGIHCSGWCASWARPACASSEVTLDADEGTADLAACREVLPLDGPDRCFVGAGTVRTLAQLRAARHWHADFAARRRCSTSRSPRLRCWPGCPSVPGGLLANQGGAWPRRPARRS